MEWVSDFVRVGSGHAVSVSDPVFDPVLSLNMRVYRNVLHFYFFIVHISSLNNFNNVAILVIRV